MANSFISRSNVHSREIENEDIGKVAIRLTSLMVLPKVLRSAIKLNLVDIIVSASSIDGGHLSAYEIAAKLPKAHPHTTALLDRMLCLLSSYDIFTCRLRRRKDGEIERVYGAGSVCKFLVSNSTCGDDDGSSLAPLFMMATDHVLSKSWDYLYESVVEGGTPFERAHGMSVFEYAGKDEKFNQLFNEGMSVHTTLVMKKLLEVYEGFEEVNVLVNVGGGIGSTLEEIISYHPHINGINFDLPHVLLDAPLYPGVKHLGGNMFMNIPKGDAIFLKSVLHNWDDEDCLKILENCWEALPNKGKVIVVEAILPVVPRNEVSSHIAFEFDMHMFAHCTGGKERTFEEFKILANKTGFVDSQIAANALGTWVIELHKHVL